MADEIYLTDGPITVTGPAKQPLRLALDVSRYDEMDLRLRVLAFQGTPSLDVRLLTSMETDAEDGFVVLGSFTQMTVPNTAQKASFKGLLKYVIWEVTAIGGASATFDLAGMIRSWS